MAIGCFKLPITSGGLNVRGVIKKRDTENTAKLQGIISNQGAFKKHVSQCAKHTDDWMSVRGTIVTDTLLAAMESHDFHVIVKTLTPPI